MKNSINNNNKNILNLPENTPQAQIKAINADEKLITVGAGAGTGKTWVLSNRYIRILFEDSSNNKNNILPSDILTLTFTEAAASEMKTRIENQINNSLNLIPNILRRREILNGLADTWISTIHSFASRLIRESGLSLDIDPTAQVISPHQEQEFWDGLKNALEFANLQALANSYSGKILRDNAKILDHDNLITASVNKWGASSLIDLARDFIELHDSLGNTWEQMLNLSENNLLIENSREIVRKILISEWRKIYYFWKNLPTLPKPSNENGPGAFLISIIDGMSNNPNENDFKNFYVTILNENIRGNAYEPFKTLKIYLGGLTLSDWRKSQPNIFNEVTKTFDDDASTPELNLRRSLLKFCAVSWGLWDSMKRRRGLLSFSDMINHAKTAIELGGINRTFKHILVDEFQDTDPLQFKMINSLAQKSDQTIFFAVGDPKQSIYRFRYAEPALFAQLIREADLKTDLDVSFRTREKLLTRINNLFAKIWPNGLGNSDLMSNLKFEPLKPSNIDNMRNNGTVPDFKIILASENLNEPKKVLAENLADLIYKFVSEKLTVWDKAQKILRHVKYSDFAILVRDRYSHDMLEEILSTRNIKSIQDRSRGFLSRGEISDVISTLKAAADFNDGAAIAGWLMSPFSGLIHDEAMKILRQIDENKNNSPVEILKLNYPETFSRLEYLSLKGELEGPAGLLSVFDRDREWLSCYAEKDKLRVLRNIREAVKIAEKFQKSGTSSLTACAEWLSRAVRSGVILDEPSWHDKNENAVLLSSIHSAKGLEYPITIIFDTRIKARVNNSQLRASKNLGLAFTNLPDEISGEEINLKFYKWDRLISEQGEKEEDMRLFYVAMTRAQDGLIFCGLLDKKNLPHKNTWTEILLNNCDQDDKDKNIIYAVENNKLLKNVDAAEQKNFENVNLIEPENYLCQVSASSYALFKFCPIAWRRKYMQGLNLKWEMAKNEDENLNFDDEFTGGADLGSLAHWILSKLKGSNINEELEESKNAIKTLGAYIDGYSKIKLPNGDERNLIYIKKISTSPNKFPRKAGTPEKKPLY